MRFLVLVLFLLFGNASAGRVYANLQLTPKNGILEAELKLEQVLNNQLLVWLWQPSKAGWKGRSSQPVEAILDNGVTVYRFVTPINEAGQWYMRTTIGAGQAAYIGFSQFYANPKEASSVFVSLENSFEDTIPSYVQPLGYAVYTLVALFAIVLTALVLRRLERRKT